MKFEIDKKIIEKYPDVKLGILVVSKLDNKGDNDELTKLSREIESNVKNKYNIQTLVEQPKIADWRKAYLAFGSKPKTYKNSVESLIRRILKPENLPNINKVVNIYNLISIKHCLPAGGDDLDKIDGDIFLTISKGDEKFEKLGNKDIEFTEENEVIYKDDKDILCRRWNWRECDKSKMTNNTKNVCLILEGLESTSKEELILALEDLKENISNFCGGNAKAIYLDKDNSSQQLNFF